MNYHTPTWCADRLGQMYDATAHICTIDDAHPSWGNACYGDSGGPLLAATPDGPVTVGVVSWGFDCQNPLEPGVYARLPSYDAWTALALADTRGDPPSDGEHATDGVTATMDADGSHVRCRISPRLVRPGDQVAYAWYTGLEAGSHVRPSANTTYTYPPAVMEAVAEGRAAWHDGAVAAVTRRDQIRLGSFSCFARLTRPGGLATIVTARNAWLRSRLVWPAHVAARRCTPRGCAITVDVPDEGQITRPSVTERTRAGRDVLRTYRVVSATRVILRTAPLAHGRRYAIGLRSETALAYAPVRYTAAITG